MANPYAAFSSPASGGADPYAGIAYRVDSSAPAAKPAGRFDSGLNEAIVNMGTGMVATPIAGLAGLATLAGNALGLTDANATDVIHSVQDRLTYQPKTQAGDTAAGVMSYPFQKLAQGADYLGGKTAEITGSPAAGAAVNTAVNFAPALISHRVFAKIKPKPADSAAAASQAAQDFVTTKTSLDWNTLSNDIKTRLAGIVKDAGSLDHLDPAAVERQIRLQSMSPPVPATSGQITRNVVQLRNEQNVSATEGGAPIRKVYVDQNRALVDNLDTLKGKIPAKATTPEQVGQSVQDSALRAKEAASKAQYDQLYKRARATEPDAKVSADPLYGFLDENPSVQHVGFLKDWLNKAKVETTTKQDGITVTVRKGLTLNELHDLRVRANGIAKSGSPDAYWAGQVVRSVDQAMADSPAGASAWKAANDAFKKHKAEFSDQKSVSQLVDDKSPTDRRVALEDTWNKTVLGGSIQDLNNVKTSLLTGEFPETRAAGRGAWRDLQAQTIEYIKQQATKSAARFEDGTPNVTPAAMQQALRSIGDAKIDAIFSKGTARQLRNIMQATRDVKGTPPPGYAGSGSWANALAFLEKGLGKIPALGDVVSGTARAIGKVHEMGRAGREVRASQEMPLPANAGANALRRTSSENALRRNSGAIVPANSANKN